MENLLAMILAGGQGSRLQPLTNDRAKPAVHFAGKYRIIDFVLNNFVNSGFYQIKILTQFKSDSLNRHVSQAWDLNRNLDQYVDMVPAQMRIGNSWYMGTADAIYQNVNPPHAVWFIVLNLFLSLEFRGLPLNLKPQHGHQKPCHFMKT